MNEKKEKPIRTVRVEDFKRDPAATTRRAMQEGPVAVMREDTVLLVVSFPQAPPLDSTS